MNRTPRLLILILAGLSFLAACSLSGKGYIPPPQHPPEAELGDSRPVCTECHDARDENVSYETLNHTAYFGEQHRQAAYQSSRLCSMCHQQSFCSDCHSGQSELKPSLKNQDRTDRRMQHRGDFLTRHRIEARIDPTPCYRCHGNPRAAQTCAPCHG